MGLAEQFLKARSKVIITGRRAGALEEAKKKFPALVTHVSDAGVTSDREELVAWATKSHPDLNILVSFLPAQDEKRPCPSKIECNLPLLLPF